MPWGGQIQEALGTLVQCGRDWSAVSPVHWAAGAPRVAAALVALPRALRRRERPRPGHRLAPGSVYYQQLLLLSPARTAWPQPTASPRLRLLPPLPPFPPLPRSSAVAAAGPGGFAATRLGSQTLGGGRRGRKTGEGAGIGRYWRELSRRISRLRGRGKAGAVAASDPEEEP